MDIDHFGKHDQGDDLDLIDAEEGSDYDVAPISDGPNIDRR
jgi:hypothetical protein